jgi:hypothetical protein
MAFRLYADTGDRMCAEPSEPRPPWPCRAVPCPSSFAPCVWPQDSWRCCGRSTGLMGLLPSARRQRCNANRRPNSVGRAAGSTRRVEMRAIGDLTRSDPVTSSRFLTTAGVPQTSSVHPSVRRICSVSVDVDDAYPLSV